MANRYITTDNKRGNAVTAADPTFAHIRGWNAGVKVVSENKAGGRWAVYMTSGSNGAGSDTRLGTVIVTDDGPAFIPWPNPLPH